MRHTDDRHPVLPGFDHPLPEPTADPVVWGPPPAATVARFWSKVTRTAGCWWWTGAVSHPDGYGRITWTQNGAPRTLSAHRFALLLDLGQLPQGTVSEHHCNETLCVRAHPEHLHPGSQSANLRYAVTLGRHRGSRPGDIDPRGRHTRALAIRAALAGGYDPLRLAAARDPNPNPVLFDLDLLNVTGAAATAGALTAQDGVTGGPRAAAPAPHLVAPTTPGRRGC